jgi:hypothetical protein
MINQEQVIGVLRIIIPAACAWLAAKGFSALSDSGIVAEITAAAIAVFAVVWSFLAHTDAAKIKSAAAIDPQVKIQIPRELMVTNKAVASLVHDDSTPNVTRLDEGPQTSMRRGF